MSRMSKQAAARIGGILTGTAALFVGGVLIASAPAFADNGPHVSYQGTTAIANGPDGCAGCHRLHSAQGDTNLLVNASETALCATCHASGAGATTDVMNGVQYTAADGTGTPTAGALRGGGFNNALIDGGAAVRGGVDPVSGRLIKTNNLIPVAATASTSTSSHSMGANATMWGSGAIGAGAGTGVTLECGSCHDPHGNGNYRILRPYGSLGAQTIVAPVAATAVSVAVDDMNSTPNTVPPVTKYVFTYTVPTGHGLLPGQPVAITGTATPAAYLIATPATISAVTATTISIPNQATDPGALAAGSAMLVQQGWPNTLKSVAGAGTGTLTFTTWAAHGLQAGQVVTIAGASPATYNLSKVTIATAPTTTTFTVTNALADAYVSGGYISGIPDAKPATGTIAAGYTVTGTTKKVYNTLNYWRADDHNYTGASIANTTAGSSAFIANTSQWCTTCHTRYLANSSTSRKFSSGDAIYTFRHTSGAKVEDSPSCMQCHVAHGSNAVMDGQFSKALKNPDGTAGAKVTLVSGDSRLLRTNNRGVCLMCHNM